MGERNWDSYHRWSKTGDGRTEFGKIWFSCSSSRQPWSSTFSSTRKSVTPCSEPKYPWLIQCHVPISIKIWPEIPDEKQPWDSFICPHCPELWEKGLYFHKRCCIILLSGCLMLLRCIIIQVRSMNHAWSRRASLEPLCHLVSASWTRWRTEILNCSWAKITQTLPPRASACCCQWPGTLVSQAEDLTPDWPLWPRHECEECWCEGARGPVPGENAGTYWDAMELKRLVLQGTDAFPHAASLPLALVQDREGVVLKTSHPSLDHWAQKDICALWWWDHSLQCLCLFSEKICDFLYSWCVFSR